MRKIDFGKISDYFLISLVSIVSIALIILEYFQVHRLISLAVAILSLLIILIKEIREKNKDSIEEAERKLTDERIIIIEREVTKKNVELEDRQKIISEFLSEGIIREEDLIKSLNQEPFVILYHYNRGIKQELLQYFPDKKKPINKILNDLGFVPVGFAHGSYFFHVIGAKFLPRPLDDVTYLEAYIKKKMRNSFKNILLNLQKNNPELYNKTKDKKLFNLSYFIGKIFPAHLSVGYVNFSSFDREFTSYYSKFSNLNKMQINEQKLNEILKLASLKIFIKQIPPKDREKIISKEDAIKQEFSINNLLDYQTLSLESWTRALSKILKNDKASVYAKVIRNSTQRYCPIIREFI